MRGAIILTNRYETYDTGIGDYEICPSNMIKEYKPLND